MISDDVIITRLSYNEGCKLKPYRDTEGKLTIGIGRCIETNPFTEDELKEVGDWQNGITKNAAFYLLRKDIIRVKKEMHEFGFFPLLNDDRQYVLIDMCFQLGLPKLKGFKKAISAIIRCDWLEAHNQILDSKYARQTPDRAEKNAKCMLNGVYKI